MNMYNHQARLEAGTAENNHGPTCIIGELLKTILHVHAVPTACIYVLKYSLQDTCACFYTIGESLRCVLWKWLLTINGTINYMGRGIMIFRRGIDITRGIGGLFWALESPERIWAH